jgi:hypothetical protein
MGAKHGSQHAGANQSGSELQPHLVQGVVVTSPSVESSLLEHLGGANPSRGVLGVACTSTAAYLAICVDGVIVEGDA